MESNDSWKDQVYRKLWDVFGNDVESGSRVMFYLDQEQVRYGGDLPPALRTLKNSLSSDNAFRAYVKRLSDDTKSSENNPKFHRFMDDIWSNILNASDQQEELDEHQCWDVAKITDQNKIKTHFSVGFARAWSLIPDSSRQQIMALIPRLINNRSMLNSVDEVVSLFSKGAGDVVMVGLAAVALAYDVWLNIKRWWKGEISGVRCLKNIIDSGVSIVSGVGGGLAGASIGSFFGPFGTLIGGITGGIIAGQVSSIFIDRLTQKIFGIPKDEALENAFRYFGLTAKASNNEINKAFRQMCLKHHPDKGGNEEDFHFVQYNMAVIKAARGEA